MDRKAAKELLHIKGWLDRVDEILERGKDAYLADDLLQEAGDSLMMKLGEAANRHLQEGRQGLCPGSWQRDPAVLADLAKRRLRSKIPALTEALTGRFSEHHGFLARVHLDLIDQHTAAIEEITSRIEVVIEPFQGFRDLICTIPGIGPLTADVIIAETGADMTRFPTAGHLASWAGTTQGSNESAGRVKSTKTRPGNPYLQGALGAAAMSLAKSPNTYLGARYRRIASRRGPMKANVAIQHTMLTAIWHMGRDGTLYEDPICVFDRSLTANAASRLALLVLRLPVSGVEYPNELTLAL